MFDFLSKGKDSFLVSTARAWFESRLKPRYGDLQDLQVDTAGRTVSLTLLPIGEAKPITLRIHSYQIVQDSHGLWLIPGPGEVNRPWMQALYDDLARDQRFQLPSFAAGFL